MVALAAVACLAAALERPMGLLLLGAAVYFAVAASRARLCAEHLGRSVPLPLDDAVEADEPAHSPAAGSTALRRPARAEGVFAGRLEANGQVSSPGGVVGAFYEAEIRAVPGWGKRGALLSVDRDRAGRVFLAGVRSRAEIEVAPGSILGPTRARRCPGPGSLAFSPPQWLATGHLPPDAVSFERVGRLGEACLAVGRLRLDASGVCRLRGGFGGPPALVIGGDVPLAVAALLRRAWTQLALALACSAASAYLLSLS